MKFPYIEKESSILGKILKPLAYIEIFSKKHGLWCGIDEVLVDTGADITLIPRRVGNALVDDVPSGKRATIKGITPSEVIVHVHSLQVRVANKEFQTKVAIADSDEVPAVLGRFEALDAFRAEFIKGKEFVLENDE